MVTGADPAFCSGDDVREIMVGEAPPTAPPPRRACASSRRRRRWRRSSCDKPLIAAVNGSAVGWGMELALYADIRIASEKAVFAELFVKRGLVCDVGGFWKLPSIVGPAKAAELLMTGDRDRRQGGRAHRPGQQGRRRTRRCCDEATALAGRIAANPPLAVRYYQGGPAPRAHGDPREVGAWAIEIIYRLFATEDHKEGVASFLEKRPAVFVGR